MKGIVTFVLASALVMLLLAAVLMLIFPGAEERRALAISALLALVVQLAAFTILRSKRQTQLLLGWGLGSLLRLATLGLYALVVARLGLPAVPALVGLAAFLFATMFIEPLLLDS